MGQESEQRSKSNWIDGTAIRCERVGSNSFFKIMEIYIMRSILLNYSQPMHHGYAHSYHYDYDAKLNVVKNEKGMVIPFVDSKDDKLCISTKTEALRESDDTANEMLLISTKTRAEMESDDEGSFIYK